MLSQMSLIRTPASCLGTKSWFPRPLRPESASSPSPPPLISLPLPPPPSPTLQVYKNVTDFTSRELANLTWALAVLDRRPGWLLDSVLSHAHDGFASYTANSLHLLLWSLGKLEHAPPAEWMQAYLHAAQASFFQFTPTEMSNVIWAFAKLGGCLGWWCS